MSEENKDKTQYYYSNKKRIQLERNESVTVVRFKQPLTSGLTRDQLPRSIDESLEPAIVLPKYNLHIYRSNELGPREFSGIDKQSIRSKLKSIRDKPDVEFATIAYNQAPGSQDVMFNTKEFTAKFKEDVTKEQIEELTSRYNVKIIKSLGYVQNGFLLEAPFADGENGAVAIANIFYESGLCEWSNPNFIKRYHWREVTSEPHNLQLSNSWHISTANIPQAWTVTKGRNEIKIAIIDDGFDRHPEYISKVMREIDFENNSQEATPKDASENHGTSCAGVAAGIGIKAPGSAPGCSLVLGRMGNIQSLADTAEMFYWMANNGADVISISWGPPDRRFWLNEPSRYYELDDNVREAVQYCVTNGRDGKGCCICWAAGNGDEPVSNDGYAANPNVIAVAASTSPEPNGAESRSYYSDYGPEIWICAPSSGNSSLGQKGIFTADRKGDRGYNPSIDRQDEFLEPYPDLDYTNGFGGTSSATPFVAGVIGLMLSANPNLTVKQIKNILKITSDKIGNQESYVPDSNGVPHSQAHGYGRINAGKAITESNSLLRNMSSNLDNNTPDLTRNIISSSSRNVFSISSKAEDEMHWRKNFEHR